MARKSIRRLKYKFFGAIIRSVRIPIKKFFDKLKTRKSVFTLIFIFFAGFVISCVYGGLGTSIVFFSDGKNAAQEFLFAYFSSFRTVISLGLILGTMLVVYFAQSEIPAMIEGVFTPEQLEGKGYYENRDFFNSRSRTVNFATILIVFAFGIFTACQFPLSRAEGETQTANILMMIAVCAEYGLASFVGRKLRYTAMMIHSLKDIELDRNLFKNRELDNINWYISVASTLTIIFVYVNVVSYYNGPFKYDTWLGHAARTFLLFPAVIATPVLLIFNFYPREVLRKLYSKSINFEIDQLKIKMKDEKLSPHEKRSHIWEVDKMSRDELRYSLQSTLTDLPIGVTILIMVLEPLLKK